MVLGIDPGIGKRKCGFAIVSDGALFHHKSISGIEALSYTIALHAIYHFDRCVIEKPRIGVIYMRHLTKKNRVLSEAGRLKIAMNIGQNIQLSDEIALKLREMGVKVKQLPPRNKNTKWKYDYWKAVFKWKGRRPSEHARDASILAYQWEPKYKWFVDQSK